MKKVLLSTIVLSLIGLLFVFEASTAESLVTHGHPYHFLRQQSMWMVIGYIGLVAAVCTPTKLWSKTAIAWYLLGIALLVLVLIPGIGREFNGARRWIGIGSLGVLQPIEPVKFSIVVFFASWMSKHQRLLPFLTRPRIITHFICHNFWHVFYGWRKSQICFWCHCGRLGFYRNYYC
jgi:cell division protein FtsW